MKMFDEKDAIDFIRRNAMTADLSDEDILDMIDAIFDYYDENGELDLDFDDDDASADDTADLEQITTFVAEAFAGSGIERDVIASIVKAETDYENSLL